jgi:transcriptional regulator with XRE-family HTH domain
MTWDERQRTIFGARALHRRRELRLSNAELARKAGVSTGVVTKIEHGRPVRESNLESVRKALSLDLDPKDVRYPEEVELVMTAVAEWILSKGSQRHQAALEVIKFIVARGASVDYGTGRESSFAESRD